MITAGAGVVVITPSLGAPLAGLFEERRATTVERDLTVRSLVLDDGRTVVALVLIDLICIPASIVAMSRGLIEHELGIPAGNVMISATHTHSGPAPTILFSTEPDQEYLETLPRRVADSVAIAFGKRRPSCISHGGSVTTSLCFNRRYRMKSGMVVINPDIGNPEPVEPSGPVDPQVTALLVEDLEGNAIALWACLSLHYVGVANNLAISPDYFGDFADAAARWLGNECVGFLTNGTSGQVNNIDVRPHDQVPAAEQRTLVAGAVAAASVQATLLQPRTSDIPIRSTRIPIDIERRTITDSDIQLAKLILTQAVDADTPDEQFSFVVGQSIPKSQVRQYASEMLDLAAWPTSIPSELQVIEIGDFVVVGLPGELFVEFGLALKAASPFSTTAVVSLTNDYVGYIPTIAAFSEGAYETWAAKSAWPAPGTGEAMVGAIVDHWHATSSGRFESRRS